jgi:hypothetical protein
VTTTDDEVNADAMSGLTIRNGHASAFGGGINGSGSLRLRDVVLRDNTASQGGALIFATGVGGELRLADVQVVDNAAAAAFPPRTSPSPGPRSRATSAEATAGP